MTQAIQARPRKGQAPSLPWLCNAWLEGRLARTKPDAGKRRLVFACADGTRFDVAGVGNDRIDGGGPPVLHLLANIDEAFNSPGYWLVYPTSFNGKPALTLALRSERPKGEVDILTFAASVKAIADGTLTLFVGRRGRPGFSFVPLVVPSGLVLPEGLRYQTWVTGTARREADRWVLASIEANPPKATAAKPRPRPKPK